jgi:hypothetical protein
LWIHFSVFLKKIKIEKEILYSSLIFNRIDFIQRKTSLSTGADADAVHSVHHPSPVLPNEKRIVFFAVPLLLEFFRNRQTEQLEFIVVVIRRMRFSRPPIL